MTIALFSEYIGNLLILAFLVGIPLYGTFRKIPVYEVFVDGAKEGFPVFLRIMPYFVGMMTAIGMLRASGAFDLLSQWLSPFLMKIGVPADIIPIAIVRPFSGGAAMGALADVLRAHGGNAFVSHLATIIATTTDTTFYIIAIYFGAVNIRKNRHAVLSSLIVDIIGMLSAVWIAGWLISYLTLPSR